MKRFAVLQLSGCAGCEVSLLNAEAWVAQYKLVYMPLVISAEDVPAVDVLLISGGVRTDEDLYKLRRAVKNAEQLGALSPVVVLKSTDRPEGEAIEAKEIPELKEKLITSSDRYGSLVPNDEKVPRILYKAAEVYYVYDHLPEARKRFESILLAYPQHEVAEFSANLIIETYLAEKDFVSVEKFSRSGKRSSDTSFNQQGDRGLRRRVPMRDCPPLGRPSGPS